MVKTKLEFKKIELSDKPWVDNLLQKAISGGASTALETILSGRMLTATESGGIKISIFNLMIRRNTLPFLREKETLKK